MYFEGKTTWHYPPVADFYRVPCQLCKFGQPRSWHVFLMNAAKFGTSKLLQALRRSPISSQTETNAPRIDKVILDENHQLGIAHNRSWPSYTWIYEESVRLHMIMIENFRLPSTCHVNRLPENMYSSGLVDEIESYRKLSRQSRFYHLSYAGAGRIQGLHYSCVGTFARKITSKIY